jgi:CPA2 family monovalent cation:H+ antiporter-2
MQGDGFFYQAFVYLAAAVIAVPVAKRLGFGSVLGYLLAGVAIGPFALGLIGGDSHDVMEFAEFGVVMMLFLVGLELEPSRLWRLRGPIIGLGGLQVVTTTALIALVTLAIGLSWRPALAVGLTLALSSTAIVLQSLAEKDLLKSSSGQNAFAVLLFQDLAVIPMLAFFPMLRTTSAVTDAGRAAQEGPAGMAWLESLPAWAEGLVVLTAIGTVVVVGRFLVGPAFRAIARTQLRELFTAAALLLVIGIALLMTLAGLSPALGAFLAGVVLATSEYRHQLEADIEPFKGLLLGLFFIAVGASIDFELIGRMPGALAGLVVLLVLTKVVVLLGLAWVFGLGVDQRILFALALAQGSEFAFVLASFAGGLGILTPQTTGTLVAVVALSMAVSPLLLLLGERLLLPRIGTRAQAAPDADAMDEDSPVIIAGFGRFGHVVGRLLRANGVRTTVLDTDADRVELLRSLGLEVFYGDASRVDLLHAAGAETAKLIVLALDSPARTLALVHTLRHHYPHLTILARASDRGDAYDLLDAGVQHVYRETLDTSLAMGIDALRLLGFRGYQAHRAARTFRKHDEAALRSLAKLRHDRAGYLDTARQWIRDLENTLRAELGDRPSWVDAGWDTDSLRQEYGGKDQTPKPE